MVSKPFDELAALRDAADAVNLAAIDAVLALHAATSARDTAATALCMADLAAAFEARADLIALPFADLALGQVALVLGDRRIALARFEQVTRGRSVAAGLAAMSHLIELAVERGDLGAARTWTAKAVARAEDEAREIELTELRRGELALAYARADASEIARVVRDLVCDKESAAIGRLLFAATTSHPEALATVALVLDEAREERSPTRFALGIVVGIRLHVAAGRLDDARALLAVGLSYLEVEAPDLATALFGILA